MASDYFQQLSKGLEPGELQVIEAKYASPRIAFMPDEAIVTAAADSLRRIHVITGWDLPNDADYVKVLVEEYVNKLKLDYSDVNFDEILYAFRKHGIGIKDWGKKMNLDLICQVVDTYLRERSSVSLKEEAAAAASMATKTYTAEELLYIQRADIEAYYQRFLAGAPNYGIPEYFLTVLQADGFMEQGTEIEDVQLLFNKAAEMKLPYLYKKD